MEMEKKYFNVSKELCGECSLALMRFIGKMEGVESFDVEDGKVVAIFDKQNITEEELTKITKDSIEKLGYKLEV